MEIRTFKHAAKMSEWQERIRVCRSSGQPVRTWCAANGIWWQKVYERFRENEIVNDAKTDLLGDGSED